MYDLNAKVEFEDLYVDWYNGLRSDNTRIAYDKSFTSLLKFTGKRLLDLQQADIKLWVNELQRQGLAAKTVCVRIASIASFYTYAKRNGWADVQNPTIDIDKPIDRPSEEIYYLTSEETKRLLSVMDRSTVIGKRDYALYLGYIMMGRRNSEIRNLKLGDFKFIDGIAYYTWSGKGKVNEVSVCPMIVWEAIADYLRAANRVKTAKKSDYIFVPMASYDYSVPLSIAFVGVTLKQYAYKAGLDVRRIHVHCLRHTAVMLRLEAGESLAHVSQFLGHSSTAITQNNYVHEVGGDHVVATTS